jgi:hypothetical protein
MTRLITFDELRRIKAQLPEGSMHSIAKELNMEVATVRNFFGGTDYKMGSAVGFHIEPGPQGGIVVIDDTTVLDRALEILAESRTSVI